MDFRNWPFNLTTTWSRPESCSTELPYLEKDPSGSTVWSIPFDIPCYPNNKRITVLSPAICPESFTTAASSFMSNTMWAFCCESGYGLDLNGTDLNIQTDFYACTRTATNLNASVISYDPAVTDYVGSPSFTVIPTAVVHGLSFQVLWQPEELKLFPDSARPALNLDIPAESSVTAELGLIQDRGLPTTTKIAIGAGAGVGVLLVIGMVVFLIFRCRRRRPSAS